MTYKNIEKKLSYNREYQRIWRAKNPEKVKAIMARTNARPERRAYIRAWQLKHPEAMEKMRERYRLKKFNQEFD